MECVWKFEQWCLYPPPPHHHHHGCTPSSASASSISSSSPSFMEVVINLFGQWWSYPQLQIEFLQLWQLSQGHPEIWPRASQISYIRFQWNENTKFKRYAESICGIRSAVSTETLYSLLSISVKFLAMTMQEVERQDRIFIEAREGWTLVNISTASDQYSRNSGARVRKTGPRSICVERKSSLQKQYLSFNLSWYSNFYRCTLLFDE